LPPDGDCLRGRASRPDAVGSFLNVVIHRLPIMMERDWARSAPNLRNEAGRLLNRCRSPIPAPAARNAAMRSSALENIPIVSWLVLRGKCRGCGTPISFRYPLIEAATGMLFASAAWHFGFTPQGPWPRCCSSGRLIALTGIDFDTQLLPDDITLPLLWAGLAFNFFNVFTSLHNSVAGAMLGLSGAVVGVLGLQAGNRQGGHGLRRLQTAWPHSAPGSGGKCCR
jgi:leader peptidase (prepilin peptidase)/N-methyltransferase